MTGDGTIASENGPLGRIKVMRFNNEQAMMAEGDRLYDAPAEADGEIMPRPGIVQGALEGSNVSAVLEMTRMMTELREFQFATQFAEREGERLQTAVDRILRKQ